MKIRKISDHNLIIFKSFGTKNFKIYGDKKYHIIHKIIEVIAIISRLWAAIWLTFLWFFAQKNWAINIDQAIENQLQIDIVKNIIVQLIVVVAIAQTHNLQTQKLSVNWYAYLKHIW
jgi:hypothetical protein